MGRKVLALWLAVLVGCGSTAMITRPDYARVEGEILGSDDDSVYVDTGSGEERVARWDIRDIDHPGNVALTLGLLLMAYGALNIAVAAPGCDERGAAFCMGVFMPVSAGLGLVIYGAKVYGRSVAAARGTSEHPEALRLRGHLLFQTAKAPGTRLQLGAPFDSSWRGQSRPLVAR